MKTMHTKCLDESVILGERHQKYSVKHFMDCCLTGRFLQGIGCRIIQPNPSPSNDNRNHGPIRCRSRLGGPLNFSHREVATHCDGHPDAAGSDEPPKLFRMTGESG